LNLYMIRTDGTKINPMKIVSFSDGKLIFTMLFKDIEVETSISAENLTSLVNNRANKQNTGSFYKNYLLTQNGNSTEVTINSIQKEKLNVTLFYNDNYITVDQMKTSIDGIYFADFLNKSEPNKPQVYGIQPDQTSSFKLKLIANAGFGYLIAAAPEGASSDQKEYIDGLRLGLAFDLGIEILPTSKIGIGLRYNQFQSSNSYQSVIKDNITVSFIGATFTSFSPFKNNTGLFYSSLSLGKGKEVNNAEYNGVDIKLEGQTFALYLAMGFEIYVGENTSIGLQAGLLGGKINEIEINGQKQKLEEPESLSRFDAMGGIKFFF
jgi:hypothetical protein